MRDKCFTSIKWRFIFIFYFTITMMLITLGIHKYTRYTAIHRSQLAYARSWWFRPKPQTFSGLIIPSSFLQKQLFFFFTLMVQIEEVIFCQSVRIIRRRSLNDAEVSERRKRERAREPFPYNTTVIFSFRRIKLINGKRTYVGWKRQGYHVHKILQDPSSDQPRAITIPANKGCTYLRQTIAAYVQPPR